MLIALVKCVETNTLLFAVNQIDGNVLIENFDVVEFRYMCLQGLLQRLAGCIGRVYYPSAAMTSLAG